MIMANKNAIIYNFRTYINLSLIFPRTVPSKIYVHNLNHIKKKLCKSYAVEETTYEEISTTL